MRKTYIDNLRIFVSVLVVFYHVFWVFNGVQEYIAAGTITQFRGQDAVLYLLYPWFMCIFFILSGMSAKLYLDRHTDREFLSARTTKLLVPSTLGVLIFGWIQGYISMNLSTGFSALSDEIPAVIKFIIMDFSGIGVLWTIQMLWLFSLLLVWLRKIEKGKLLALGKKSNIIVMLLLGIPAWGFAQILNTPVITVYRFGIYGFCFFCGYYVFSHDEVIERLEKWFIPLVIAGAGLAVAYTIVYFGRDYTVEPAINSPLAICFAWICCLALIALFKHCFNNESGFTRFMSKRSYGLYLFHYLGLSGAALLLKKYTGFTGAWIYLVCAAAALVTGFVLPEISNRQSKPKSTQRKGAVLEVV